MNAQQQSNDFDAETMHDLLQDVEVAVRQAYGVFDTRTAIKDLLTIPCREAGHLNYDCLSVQYTPVTYSLASGMMLVLIDVTDQPFCHGPDRARFVSALAMELTMHFSALVAPAQRSDEQASLVAPSGRKFAVFQFALLDKPSRSY